ncbi:MAG: hypothetical protein LAP38_24590 [Acidobacteriia bacterium]|nr:hypothetical protein [Terriglobia bacterium]
MAPLAQKNESVLGFSDRTARLYVNFALNRKSTANLTEQQSAAELKQLWRNIDRDKTATTVARPRARTVRPVDDSEATAAREEHGAETKQLAEIASDIDDSISAIERAPSTKTYTVAQLRELAFRFELQAVALQNLAVTLRREAGDTSPGKIFAVSLNGGSTTSRWEQELYRSCAEAEKAEPTIWDPDLSQP